MPNFSDMSYQAICSKPMWKENETIDGWPLDLVTFPFPRPDFDEERSYSIAKWHDKPKITIMYHLFATTVTSLPCSRARLCYE